jgi:FkbM family methyltransferase
MASWRALVGAVRSVIMYYAIPFRLGRMARFYGQFAAAGELCFDIGAHAGNRVAAFRKIGARVVAVEPQPLFAEMLRKLYGRDGGVEVIEEGVGAKAGEAELLISQLTPTVTTMSLGWAEDVQKAESFASVKWEERVTVKITTLDAMIEKYGEPVFCKIDVEGYELEVLKGLSRPIKALSVEYIPATPEIVLGCMDKLGELGKYEFNVSVGESHRMVFDAWQEGGKIKAWLGELGINGRSGDLYARTHAHS